MRTFETLEMSARCSPGFEENKIFDYEPYGKDSALVLDIDKKQENKNRTIRSVESSTINYKGKNQKSIF